MYANEIAETLEVSPSTITYILDKLEQKHLIERMHNPRNRRVTQVALTPEGSQELHHGYSICDETTLEMIEPLGSFLRKNVPNAIKTSETNYSSLSSSGKYLVDNTLLNTLMLYELKMVETLKEHGLTGNEFRVLFELMDHPRSIRTSDLARILLARTSEVTAACNKLEEGLLIRRDQSSFDRRAVLIELTSSGYEVLRETAPKIDEIFFHSVKTTPVEDRDRLHKTVRIILKRQRKQFLCK